VITHAASLKGRAVTGARQQMRQPRPGPERGDVVGGAVGVGSGHAIPGDQAVHQARIAGGHRLEVQPGAPQRTRADVGDEHVCGGQQFERRGRAAGCAEVEHDAALTAVVHLERRAQLGVQAQHPAEHPRRIACRWFELDDVRAPVGQYSARRRASHPNAQLDDFHAFHRSDHGKTVTVIYDLVTEWQRRNAA
jgi:hypothetical protein